MRKSNDMVFVMLTLIFLMITSIALSKFIAFYILIAQYDYYLSFIFTTGCAGLFYLMGKLVSKPTPIEVLLKLVIYYSSGFVCVLDQESYILSFATSIMVICCFINVTYRIS